MARGTGATLTAPILYKLNAPLPSEEKGDWVVMSSGSSEPANAGAAEAEPNVDSPPYKISNFLSHF